jgi:hypothetical protein
MLLAALTIFLQAAAPAGAAIDDQGTITVTARRISDLAADVAACAAAPCPPRRDVAVSVAYASALFDEGKYRDAKGVLGDAVSRAKGAAAAEPMAVSILYNAQANLMLHEGDQDLGETATRQSYLVLRDNLGPDALPTLSAGYRLANWLMRRGRLVESETLFTNIAEAAAAGGYMTLADASNLHRGRMLVLRLHAPEGYALLEAVAARPPGPDGNADMQRAALATAVRLATNRGEEARAQGYADKLAALGAGEEPQLVFSKPWPLPPSGVAWHLPQRGLDNIGTGGMNGALPALRWVDVGYWIRPDGSVDDIEVLRGSRTRGWEAPVLSNIASRRYAPTRDPVGQYRVERYTLTADYFNPSGSLIRRRGLNPRFEMQPLTGSAASPS